MYKQFIKSYKMHTKINFIITLVSILIITSISCEDNVETPIGNITEYDLSGYDYVVLSDKGTDKVIAFFGDSRTYFLPTSTLPETTYNYGVGGYTSFGVFWKIEKLEANSKITDVCIAVGVNDVIGFWAYPAEYINNMDKIITLTSNKYTNAKIHISSIVYVAEAFKNFRSSERHNEIIKDLNNQLYDLCLSHNVDYIEMNDFMSNGGYLKPEFTNDSLHYSEGGNNRLLDGWVECIK